ncbi:hypothetical protein SUGI_0763150 [Cryptomeria japonica]|nr:hypothetical protein SUGI_0763150 [Cryptomeria japonica]
MEKQEDEAEKNAGEKLSAEDKRFEQFYDSVKAIRPDKSKSGILMFCGGETQMYTWEDALCASAKIMERGNAGTSSRW